MVLLLLLPRRQPRIFKEEEGGRPSRTEGATQQVTAKAVSAEWNEVGTRHHGGHRRAGRDSKTEAASITKGGRHAASTINSSTAATLQIPCCTGFSPHHCCLLSKQVLMPTPGQRAIHVKAGKAVKHRKCCAHNGLDSSNSSHGKISRRS